MIPVGGLRAVFLDMDDTICDTEGLTPLRLASVRAALAGVVDAELLRRVTREAVEWDPIGQQTDGGPPNRLERMTRALALSDEQARRMRVVYNDALFAHLKLEEGVEDILAWLRERVLLGLITNGPGELQRRKIATLGIEGSFDSITISGEVGQHKPDPSLFVTALETVGVRAKESLYLGDRPIIDIGGAQRAGMTAILIRKRYPFPLPTEPQADFTIDRIHELPGLILRERWLSDPPRKPPLRRPASDVGVPEPGIGDAVGDSNESNTTSTRLTGAGDEKMDEPKGNDGVGGREYHRIEDEIEEILRAKGEAPGRASKPPVPWGSVYFRQIPPGTLHTIQYTLFLAVGVALLFVSVRILGPAGARLGVMAIVLFLVFYLLRMLLQGLLRRRRR
ncbi:MAG: HAD family hydrolase [Chloroflexi bacterium]|nr:HAD family hydrolase [Chloroflexota bacterium]